MRACGARKSATLCALNGLLCCVSRSMTLASAVAMAAAARRRGAQAREAVNVYCAEGGLTGYASAFGSLRNSVRILVTMTNESQQDGAAVFSFPSDKRGSRRGLVLKIYVPDAVLAALYAACWLQSAQQSA